MEHGTEFDLLREELNTLKDQKIRALEDKVARLEYVLYGPASIDGLVHKVAQQAEKINAIEKTLIRYGGMFLGAQIVVSIIFTIINNVIK